jgi:transposase
MFWGCFSGSTKGPCLFWEKEWKSINKESYSERIVPLVDGWLQLNPLLRFMQDGAPGHSAAYTQEQLLERGIRPIFWPAFSPNLNPIEAVWNNMKDYIVSLSRTTRREAADI